VDVPPRLREQLLEHVRGRARLDRVVLEQGIVGEVVTEAERGAADARADIEDPKLPAQQPPFREVVERVLHCRIVPRKVVDRVPAATSSPYSTGCPSR